jgi:asparagine synthase (glutamine-hydrolysing)
MSGIGGSWNLDGRPLDRSTLGAMSESLVHRGSDADGLWVGDCAGLFCRLRRVTPESGGEQQPWVHPAGTALVFDGRLDSRDDCFSLLTDDPQITRACSDAALVAAVYRKVGDRFCDYLSGDFALGLFDSRDRRLLLARDAIGARPLYYYSDGATFVFASEIKGLLCHPAVVCSPDATQLAHLMFRVPLPATSNGLTFLRDIRSVAPAHLMIVSPDRCNSRRYWDFDGHRQMRLGSFSEYAEGFRHHFQTAVRRRMRSAFPVGCSVSGGVDSSSIFCTAEAIRRQQPGRHPALIGASLTYAEGSASDEQVFLREIERRYGVEMMRIPADPKGLLEGVHEELWHVESPTLDVQWSITHTLRSAIGRAGARVLLTGQWADGVLFNRAYLTDLLRRLRFFTIHAHQKESRRWTDADPKSWRSLGADLVRHALPPRVRYALRATRNRLVAPPDVQQAFTRAFRTLARGSPHGATAQRSFRSAHARSVYEYVRSPYEVLYMEWNNKAAAMTGLDVAFPFLDRDLLSFLMAVPGEIATWRGIHKALLREAMRGVVPSKIRRRSSKADFTDVVNASLILAFDQVVKCMQRDPLAVRYGFVNSSVGSEIGRMRSRVQATDCMMTWNVSDIVGLELWLQIFCGESRAVSPPVSV